MKIGVTITQGALVQSSLNKVFDEGRERDIPGADVPVHFPDTLTVERKRLVSFSLDLVFVNRGQPVDGRGGYN